MSNKKSLIHATAAESLNGPNQNFAPCFCIFQLLKSLTPEENSHGQHGLYFEDGQRRVDYILTYHLKKAAAGRSIRHSAYPLIESAVARSLRRGLKTQDKNLQHGNAKTEKEPSSFQVDLELGSLGETLSSQEDQKAFKREEFEGKLRDVGLELEKDEVVSIDVGSVMLSGQNWLDIFWCSGGFSSVHRGFICG